MLHKESSNNNLMIKALAASVTTAAIVIPLASANVQAAPVSKTVILRKGGLIMNISMYKPLIIAVVVGLYVYIYSKYENSVFLNFVILYIVITIVYLLFRKIEKKRKEKE
ncbi:MULTISPECIES: hypothetical protein [Lysinibacillus]|uniref:hypothetical protein n=1 Tax=Lysinibacillus TaxID=400634 RepID=UPI0005640C7D|nr:MULTISPECIES: hypothetical protein [Lysinibacillus]